MIIDSLRFVFKFKINLPSIEQLYGFDCQINPISIPTNIDKTNQELFITSLLGLAVKLAVSDQVLNKNEEQGIYNLLDNYRYSIHLIKEYMVEAIYAEIDYLNCWSWIIKLNGTPEIIIQELVKLALIDGYINIAEYEWLKQQAELIFLDNGELEKIILDNFIIDLEAVKAFFQKVRKLPKPQIKRLYKDFVNVAHPDRLISLTLPPFLEKYINNNFVMVCEGFKELM